MSASAVSNRSPALGYGLGLVGILVFGSTLPVTALALEHFSPAFITFGRGALAQTAAMLLLVVMRRRFPRGKWRELLLGGLFTVFGFPLMMALALKTVPSAHGGVVLGVLPLLTAVFAATFAGERLPALFWFAAVSGAALVIAFSLRDSGLAVEIGDLWLLGAAICASMGYVMFGKLARSMPPWETISWALVLTAPISFAATALTIDLAALPDGAAPWLELAWLGLFSQYIGFFAWNAGLAIGGIARVGQVQLLQAFVTIALSAWMLGERVTLATIGFAVAVGAVVWLGSRARSRARGL